MRPKIGWALHYLVQTQTVVGWLASEHFSHFNLSCVFRSFCVLACHWAHRFSIWFRCLLFFAWPKWTICGVVFTIRLTQTRIVHRVYRRQAANRLSHIRFFFFISLFSLFARDIKPISCFSRLDLFRIALLSCATKLRLPNSRRGRGKTQTTIITGANNERTNHNFTWKMHEFFSLC